MVILLEIKPKITNILEEHSYTRLKVVDVLDSCVIHGKFFPCSNRIDGGGLVVSVHALCYNDLR